MENLSAALGRVREPGERLATQLYFSAHQALRSHGAAATILAALTNYETTTHERKLLEKAARELTKKRLVIKRGGAETRLYEFRRELVYWRELLTKLLREGRLLSSETVHAFVVVNAGGFSPAVMKSVSGQVKKAGTLLADKGLAMVDYGEVVITNTVLRGHHILAFYLLEEDRLYIRANRRKASSDDMIHAVIHELGHRLYERFLSADQKRAAEALYWDIRNRPYAGVEGPFSGQTVKEGKKQYVVIRVTGGAVLLKSEAGKPAVVKLSAWPQLTGKSPFVTPYAAKSPEENFCEMLAFYCMDPKFQESAFEAILPT